MRRRVVAWALARRFDAAAAGDLQATLQLTVGDAPYALVITGGRCRVRCGPAPDAGARARVARRDLLALARGRVTWPELFASGRFELGGDPFLAMRLPALFRLRVPDR